MEYVVMKDEQSGKVELIGRFGEYGIGESFKNGKWMENPILVSLLYDGLLETVSESEANSIISNQFRSSRQTV